MAPSRKLSFAENFGRLSTAFRSGWQLDVAPCAEIIKNLEQKRTAVVGSGASRSLAIFAEKALRSCLNVYASAIPPLGLSEDRNRFDAGLLFSASGDNVDARFAADVSLAAGFDPLIVFTQNPHALILRELADYKPFSPVVGRMRDRNQPEHEGFLGILTLCEALAAFCKTLSLALNADWSGLPSDVDQWVNDSHNWMANNTSRIANLLSSKHLVALGGYWSEPVLADLESKWVEGGLGWIEISEFRNFSHGRYMNSFRHKADTTFVFFSTPDDAVVDRETYQLLSNHFEVIRFSSSQTGPVGVCELLVWMLQLCKAAAEGRQINVTAPEVPDEGRQLFAGLRIYPHLGLLDRAREHIQQVVESKRIVVQQDGLDQARADALVPYCVVRAAYTLAVAERYNAIGLDFDGTLVPLRSGDDVPSDDICRGIERISSRLIPVGIFTGRGKSVLKGLREGLPKAAWRGITCFLYNGALRWELEADSPRVFAKINCVEAVLAIVAKFVPRLAQYFGKVERSSFDCQITINIDPETPSATQAEIVRLLGQQVSTLQLSVASSGRSIDIFPAVVSKRWALRQWRVNRIATRWESQVLLVGDRGDRTGNDFEFLSLSGGFSVDKIDWSPRSCFPVQPFFRNGQVENGSVGPSLTSLLLQRLELDGDRIVLLGLL